MSPGSFCQKIGAAHGLAAAYWRWQKRKADDAAAPGSRCGVGRGEHLSASKLEAAYHRADKAIQQIVDLLAA
jgi:hypothetical protein